MNSDKRLKRERIILDHAKHLVSTYGFEGTTMQQIAMNCGLAVGTLYNYFPSKNDILIALFKNEIQFIIKKGEPIAKNPSRNLLDSFSALFKEYSQLFTFCSKKLWVKFLAEVAVKIDAVNIEGHLWKHFELLREQIEEMIILMKGKNYINGSIDERVLSMMLFNMFYLHLREYVYSEYTVEKILESFEKQIDVLITGIRHQ